MQHIFRAQFKMFYKFAFELASTVIKPGQQVTQCVSALIFMNTLSTSVAVSRSVKQLNYMLKVMFFFNRSICLRW